jgi:release factor glutamine methyltransferase
MALEFPQANVVATDISLAALAVARRNAHRLGAGGRMAFIAADLLTAFRADCFDLIVCNPPYVADREMASLPREIREHEPKRALIAGDEGTEFYPLLFAQAASCLSPGGILAVELGYGQGERVKGLLDSSDWREPFVTTDLAGIDRVLAAERT